MTNGSQQNSDKYEIKRETVPVSAKHCLWFVKANEGAPGPYFDDCEEVVSSEYRPIGRSLSNIGRVRFMQDSEAEWGHGGARTDANGNADVLVDLQDQRYRTDYNAPGIPMPLKMPVNSLVAIFELSDGTLTAPTKMEVGKGVFGPWNTVPPNTTHWYLGFHDGKRWCNNEGEIVFTVEKESRKD